MSCVWLAEQCGHEAKDYNSCGSEDIKANRLVLMVIHLLLGLGRSGCCDGCAVAAERELDASEGFALALNPSYKDVDLFA